MQRYDATAHLYDMRYMKEQEAKYSAALENMKVRELGCVLDAGCGTGLFFNYITDKADIIVGLDISKKTLLVAKKNVVKLSNVHLICADMDNIPLREHIFDHVFAFTVLQNSPDPVNTVKTLGSFAKDNALFVVSGMKKAFSARDFEALLLDAGLKVNMFIDEHDLKCYVAVCTRIYH